MRYLRSADRTARQSDPYSKVWRLQLVSCLEAAAASDFAQHRSEPIPDLESPAIRCPTLSMASSCLCRCARDSLGASVSLFVCHVCPLTTTSDAQCESIR